MSLEEQLPQTKPKRDRNDPPKRTATDLLDRRNYLPRGLGLIGLIIGLSTANYINKEYLEDQLGLEIMSYIILGTIGFYIPKKIYEIYRKKHN